jgi:acyl-coenzyme A thioesterase 13
MPADDSETALLVFPLSPASSHKSQDGVGTTTPLIPPPFTDKLDLLKMDERWSSQIKGNATEEAKRYCWAMFKYFVNEPHWFSSKIGHSVKLVEVNVWDVECLARASSGGAQEGEGSGRPKPARAETIFEVEVTEDMCNLFGIMHGACAAYLIDQ